MDIFWKVTSWFAVLGKLRATLLTSDFIADVDVCHLDNGGCSHTCEDLIGLAYVCKCPVTMTLMNDTRTCIGET